MSPGVKIKVIKDVKVPRPKRSQSTGEDEVFKEGLGLYAAAIASENCKISDLKIFLEFLMLRGAYLENNHKEWLDRIYVEIRDLIRGKDVGPLHLALLMQAVEIRAMQWNLDMSIDSYYQAKVPVAIQLQDGESEMDESRVSAKENGSCNKKMEGVAMELNPQKAKIVKGNITVTPLRKLRPNVTSECSSETPVAMATAKVFEVVAKQPRSGESEDAAVAAQQESCKVTEVRCNDEISKKKVFNQKKDVLDNHDDVKYKEEMKRNVNYNDEDGNVRVTMQTKSKVDHEVVNRKKEISNDMSDTGKMKRTVNYSDADGNMTVTMKTKPIADQKADQGVFDVLTWQKTIYKNNGSMQKKKRCVKKIVYDGKESKDLKGHDKVDEKKQECGREKVARKVVWRNAGLGRTTKTFRSESPKEDFDDDSEVLEYRGVLKKTSKVPETKISAKKVTRPRSASGSSRDHSNNKNSEDPSESNAAISVSATNELFRNLLTKKRLLGGVGEHDNRCEDFLCDAPDSLDSASVKSYKSEKSAKSCMSEGKSVIEALKVTSRMRMDQVDRKKTLKPDVKVGAACSRITFGREFAEVLLVPKVTGFISLMTNTTIEIVRGDEDSSAKVLFKIVGAESDRERALQLMTERAGEKFEEVPEKRYEEKKLKAALKTAVAATPRRPSIPRVVRLASVEESKRKPSQVHEVFADAKIRHNRDSLNFECDIFLPSSCLTDIDQKMLNKLQRVTDSRLRVTPDSDGLLQHISIQGPLKSNIRHCLEVLENLILPDSDEDASDILKTPFKTPLNRTKSCPWSTEFGHLSNEVSSISAGGDFIADFDPNGLTGRGKGAMTLQEKIKAKGEQKSNAVITTTNGRNSVSTSAHGDGNEDWEGDEAHAPFIFGQKQMQVTSVAVNHAKPKITPKKSPPLKSPLSVSCTEVPLPADSPSPSERPSERPTVRRTISKIGTLKDRMVSQINGCLADPRNSTNESGDFNWAEYAAATSPQGETLDRRFSTQTSVEEDVWRAEDDIFLSELENRLERFHLSKQQEEDSTKEQTSPFGKYGIMATIEKHQVRTDADQERANLERVARRSLRSQTSESDKDSSPPLRSYPATPRKSSSDEENHSWRSPPLHYDDASSTTSLASVSTQQDISECKLIVIRRPIHWAMSLQSLRAAENMIPDTGAYGARARREIFRQNSRDVLRGHSIQPEQKSDFEERRQNFVNLALSPASKMTPQVCNWPALVRTFPNICLNEPWGFDAKKMVTSQMEYNPFKSNHTTD